MSAPASASPPRSSPSALPGVRHERAILPHDRRWAAGLALLFFCIVAIGLAHHEMWRDEWQAWMIARDSHSVRDLFHNFRDEGHPAGWFLLLYGLSRLTRDPVAMQGLHLLIATTSVYLLGRFAPLPRLQKGLLAFGYFFAFEYAVISRSYAPGVLALCAFCALFPVRHRHPLPLFLSLAALASFSVYGVILSLAAVAVLAVELIASPERRHQVAARLRMVSLAVAIWLAAGSAAIVQIRPPVDAAFRGIPVKVEGEWRKRDMAATAARLWKAYVPIPDLSTDYPWNTHLLPARPRPALALLLLLALVLVAAAVALFLRKPLVLLLYLVGTGGLLAFSYLFHAGSLRHDGHLFLVFVACLWLAAQPSWEWRLPPRLHRWTGTGTRWGRGFVTAVLLAQVAAATVLYVADLRRPFSASEKAARFLRDQGLDRLPIAGSHSLEMSTIAGLLDRPVHHLDAGADWTFIPWRHYRGLRREDRERLMEHLRPFLDSAGSEVVLLINYPFDAWDGDLAVTPLAHFPAGIEGYEAFRIFRVERSVQER